jgi:6-pyruvoyltetrahydropterin/6-carboxytetrahydropterin synthase
MIYVTRRAEFSASHVYHNPQLSPEENRRIFGKCNNPHGHGHNYTLEVTVAGSINPTTGMVVDLKELKTILEREVLGLLDHKFLNQEVPAFAVKIPTSENIAVEIWRLLEPKLSFGKLHRIRLYETSDLYVDYYGD